MSDLAIEDRAAALLRARRGRTTSLTRLYRALVAEIGPALSSPAQLHARLRRRPDRFLLLEPASASGTARAWSREARREYGAVVEDTGLVPEPRVTLLPSDAADGDDSAPTGPADEVLRRMHEALTTLSRTRAPDAVATGALVEAMSQLRELRRALAAAPAP